MSLSNNRVLKKSDESHTISTFSMKAVNIPEGDIHSGNGRDSDSETKKTGEKAYKTGFTDCIHAGRLQILGEIGNEIKLLRTIIEGIDKVREEIYEKIESDVVEMSLMISRKIIYRILEQEQEIVVAIAKEAIKKASDREMLKIKINPADLEIMNKKRSELLQCMDGIKGIIFEEDESITQGGCLIETNQGDVDARIESQLKVIGGEMRRQNSEVRD